MGDMNWRDKDDLDLISEDITAMAAEGEPAVFGGTRLPGDAALVSTAATYNPTTLVPAPQLQRRLGQLVGASPTRAL